MTEHSYEVEYIPVLHRKAGNPQSKEAHWDGVKPESRIIEKGFKKSDRHRAFREDTIFDKDVAVPLRDGTVIRADVFRPARIEGKVPALLAWGPYGKSGTGFMSLDLVQGRVGVPQHMLSGFESFEAPDPAEWTARGYAIVNVDSRGVLGSNGDIRWWGSAEGRDGFDTLEYIAQLSWCNGRCSLVGNSWLAIAQWFIAAEQPPHLYCMAPLEGASDLYRETICRGGIPYKPFWNFLAEHGIYGSHEQEDVLEMADKWPLMNEYWEDKRANVEKINVPSYVLASYSTGLHTAGSFRGFEGIPHEKKWLRVHPTQEWHDLYQPDCIEDLQKFFDCYLKELDNGWENTPRVRCSLLGFNKDPLANLVFPDWPIPSTVYQSLYLSSNGGLSETAPTDTGEIGYQSDIHALQIDSDPEELHFRYTFQETAFLVGYSKVVLYMSCKYHDNMDVFVQLRKADKDDNLLQNINIPLSDLGMKTEEVETINSLKYLGPTGMLRASHRAIDSERSQENRPFHPHTKDERIIPGQIVKLEFALWPTGIVFQKGESLVLKVAGHHMTLAEFIPLRGQFQGDNEGQHCLHVGPEHQSHIVIPFVPAKQ